MDKKIAKYIEQYRIAVGEKDAAKSIGLAPKTLQKYRREGVGPPYSKIGSRVVYQLSHIKEWLDARTCDSTSEYKEAKGQQIRQNFSLPRKRDASASRIWRESIRSFWRINSRHSSEYVGVNQ